MDKEKFIEAIQNIGKCSDEVERRTLLAKLSDDTSTIFDENATLKTEKEKYESEKEKYEADNEKLRKANMELFLRVGSEKSKEEQIKDSTGLETKPPVEKRKFEDLFDEKGGIK